MDSRQLRTDKIFLELYDIKVQVQTLPYGDYIFIDDSSALVFELKTTFDFLNAAREGRLYSQLRNLTLKEPGLSKTTYIVVTTNDLSGDLLAAKSIIVHLTEDQILSSFWGAVRACMVGWKVPVVFIKKHDFFEHILKPLSIPKVDGNKIYTSRTFKKVGKNLNALRLTAVTCIPGVGTKTANILLNSFRDIRGIANASKEEIVALGIKEAVAGNIVRFFCGK